MDLILQHFPKITPKQQEQFAALGELYKEWNEKINVISRKDMDNFYERHVLHSLGIAKVMSFKGGTEIMDVGTGGGFPGVPLAILFPDCPFFLVDSIGKKIKVVEEVCKSAGIKNVEARQMRAEETDRQFDFVVSRAVTRITPFYSWVRTKFLKNSFNDLDNGILYLKGGDLTEELAELGKPVKMYNLSDYFPGEFFETKKVIYVKAKG